MSQNNPFSLSFGKKPQSTINRATNESEIIDNFQSENPAYQVCMITGVRGSGKTVSMTTIANRFKNRDNWIVVDLNPEVDMIHALAVELSNHSMLIQIFKDAKINLSFLGLGVELKGTPPITDISVALDRMLEHLTKINKKILVTIDEVSNNKSVRTFTSQFQIYMRKNYSVFLIMTGLYGRIFELQNDKTHTFLYRAPKLELKPLNLGLIAESYKRYLGVTNDEANEMAKLTLGYPFAYQVLGYLCFEKKMSYTDVIPEFDFYLEELVYEKIWSEIFTKDKSVLRGMCNTENTKVEAIRSAIDMDSNNFTVYRKRLLKKGLIRDIEYGHLTFALPRFKEFIQRQIF
jgi:hypothetical protein